MHWGIVHYSASGFVKYPDWGYLEYVAAVIQCLEEMLDAIHFLGASMEVDGILSMLHLVINALSKCSM